MFQIYIKKIKKLYQMKIFFDLPKKNDLLLYDEINSSILKEIIKKDFSIFKTRNLEIYFWIILKQLFFLDFRFSTYTKNYIKFISPKIIITLNDRNHQFYKLKDSFKKIYFISIQNGVHFPIFFKTKEFTESKNLKCDHIFVFNKYYIKKYKKFIKSKYHTLGKFTNNIVKVKKKKIYNNFLLISQFDKTYNDWSNFYEKLLFSLNIYFSNSNKKLHILLRNKNPLKRKEEINFYKKYFQSNCVFQANSNWKKSYEIIDKFENIIFMHSALGYEAISRKKKVAIFSPKKISNLNYWFGWPDTFQKKHNFFSAKNLNYSETKRVLNNISNCSQSGWDKKHYITIKDQHYLNKKNTKLKKIIFNLL